MRASPKKGQTLREFSENLVVRKLLLMSGASEEPDGGLGVWASARCAAARLTGIGAIEFSRADEAAFASVSHQLGLISSTIHERRVHVGWGVCGRFDDSDVRCGGSSVFGTNSYERD